MLTEELEKRDGEPTFRVLRLEYGTSVDGPGLRLSIYLAGCAHNCPGCHNPQSHDPHGGEETGLSTLLEIVEEESLDVTLTGGDPLFRPRETALLASSIKRLGRNVWLYTGYTAEEILARADLREAVACVDTVVEGRFILSQRDPELLFRGSSNQRILDVHGNAGSLSFTEHIFDTSPDFD